LVEAKSHIGEVYGPGCDAHAKASVEKIRGAIAKTKVWCGAPPGANWEGPLYQSANRLAHLYFLREQLHQSAWMVNLYFLDDPIGPTSRSSWEGAIAAMNAELGLQRPPPGLCSIFLRAIVMENPR
jgi:hypothetical protein